MVNKVDISSQEGKNKFTDIKTFPVPFALGEIKDNITISTNTTTKPSKEKIINQAFKFHSQGNISEAIKYYQYFINQGFKDLRVFSNYGIILKNLGKLKEAEVSTRNAIELNPDDGEIHSNLGLILRDLGNLKEAELSYRKAIELNPDFAVAHSNLGSILIDLGNLKEAEISCRKAIELSPNFAVAYSNLGLILRDLGNLKEAELSYHKAIEIKPDYEDAYSNLGNILKDLGKLNEAEVAFRKAIEIKPDLAEAHSNLGNVLKDLGKLKEAKVSYHKAIEIKPDLAKAYFALSIFQYSNENNIFKDQLFSADILTNKSKKEQIDIYFARANILHKENNYGESSRYYELANKLKYDIYSSKSNARFDKSKVLLIEADKKELNKLENRNYNESIFIVGMPRSGSTLLESILSMSDDVYDLGEVNILEELFIESKKSKQEMNLAELYEYKVNNKTELNITTNKYLYNYQYAGIIARDIPNAKIIHCYRNPLDNILSIFRANFAKGNEFSSSIIDCTKVYLDQEQIMTKYKNRYRSQIYDLNYDLLVNNPNKEIKSLISWLGWQWSDSYLSPHLNPRPVSTASSVEVRSPINKKSIGGWKNYKEMLKPAIEILTKNKNYRDINA